MIVLDTHIWIWWVQGDRQLLSRKHEEEIERNKATGLGLSAISCLEVARLAEGGRISLPCDVSEWITEALGYPGVILLPLSPQISVASVRLPGKFHKDPADRIIVATARHYNCPLVTVDWNILQYEHVTTIAPS